ncbi:sigma-70 family RNA polymerase sigma factor [Marivita sp. XM-24bin2]|jgi:RNA polymerase sigma-70 factor (ECF subfamily)|uniref:sigma-70 family RNA polymerase sigma factor n=1 Tax=unclassified Marivita TaxID=2632480 RepID=UPI000D79F6ED|nr:sigma-70 family RNA polymerase sigma factor [Marivita sp. XM-24bin2]MCR9110552.1 sigma-70 family RNA polymerase sigma factor [Paracoccaceae bacterium]PWL33643.1 MAG: RNA polymerase subunit sigma [Marivita sp. XM-24bin2]
MTQSTTDSAAEAALLRAYAAGDGEAARSLAAKYTPLVYAHAVRMLNDRAEAEDVTQEAMLRLWRQAPDWDANGRASVRTWLYRVTANLCIDRLRKTRPDVLPEGLDVVDQMPGAEERLQTEARRLALEEALMQLPDRQRQAVVLRHIEGLGNTEIAQIMDIGPRAVESLTARGKRTLTALLSGQRTGLGYTDDTIETSYG